MSIFILLFALLLTFCYLFYVKSYMYIYLYYKRLTHKQNMNFTYCFEHVLSSDVYIYISLLKSYVMLLVHYSICYEHWTSAVRSVGLFQICARYCHPCWLKIGIDLPWLPIISQHKLVSTFRSLETFGKSSSKKWFKSTKEWILFVIILLVYL